MQPSNDKEQNQSTCLPSASIDKSSSTIGCGLRTLACCGRSTGVKRRTIGSQSDAAQSTSSPASRAPARPAVPFRLRLGALLHRAAWRDVVARRELRLERGNLGAERLHHRRRLDARRGVGLHGDGWQTLASPGQRRLEADALGSKQLPPLRIFSWRRRCHELRDHSIFHRRAAFPEGCRQALSRGNHRDLRGD
jgi:hypothetical protein